MKGVRDETSPEDPSRLRRHLPLLRRHLRGSNHRPGRRGEFRLDLPIEQAYTAFITRPGYLNMSIDIPKRQSANPFPLTINLTPHWYRHRRRRAPVAGADVAALSYQLIDGKRVPGNVNY